ncbi:UNVERIFIED_CONTAM: hypothetical protein Slati_1511100 [Sesamum latifolium]|uniref:Integrase zinc-binding domain-containing protein n=1 Tax=Sesamum latifolium TaxID=2727402 RepID=A0AAW2X5V7_9LAMI
MGSCQAQTRATRFIMQEHILYKKSYTHPLLRCLSTEEGIHILQKIHSGCCGAHAGTRILANKALRAGYFWPTMKHDAIRLVSKCERCQKHSSLIHQPAEPLTTMLSPYPFMQWGMDIVGPFPLAAGQRKFFLVAIDYFTKWVEAEPLARITEGEAEEYKNGVKACTLGKDSPQWLILKPTGKSKTTPRGSTGESPFSLVYGTEAIIPAELGIPSHRVMNFSEEYALKPIGKLDPTWEGPYKVTSVIAKGAYELENPDGHPLLRPWNVHNLKKYFV